MRRRVKALTEAQEADSSSITTQRQLIQKEYESRLQRLEEEKEELWRRVREAEERVSGLRKSHAEEIRRVEKQGEVR